MISFFKNFGKGILYVLVLPFLLVGLAIYAVVALFIFLFMSVKALILFFTGRSIFDDTEEDKEAKKRIAKANGTYVEEASIPTQQEGVNTTKGIENDPFYIPDYMKSEEDRQQMVVEEEKVEEQMPQLEEENKQEIFEEQVKEKVEINEEIPQKSPQNDAFFAIEEDEEDESKDSSGVDIHFE